jgi:hypothetical protein
MLEAIKRIQERESQIADKYTARNDSLINAIDEFNSEDVNPIDEGLAFPIVEDNPHHALLAALGLLKS